MDEWAEVFSAQLENARWLIAREDGRIEGFHQRASYLLGFTGVILAIMPVLLDPIGSMTHGNPRLAAWSLALLAALSLGLGAIFSLITLSVKDHLGVPVKAIQKLWIDWSSESLVPQTSQVLADYANALLGRSPTAETSALLAIHAEGDVRGNQLRIATWSSTCGIVALGALFALLLAVRL
jgi:hypothetical protein